MILINMRYLWSPLDGKCFEFSNDTAFENYKLLHPENLEVSKDDAYMRLFYRISRSMNLKYQNYNFIDISNNVLLMMMERYKKSGLFAPDKPFTDNAKMWWVYADKSCLYLIRCYKNRNYDVPSDLMNINASYSLYSEAEHESVCDDILEYINELSLSKKPSEQQMGIFALCKLQGLSDEHTTKILDVGLPRIREIKLSLKRKLISKFGEDLND